jgi:hypothetical protein
MRMGSPKYTDAAKETIKSMRQYFHDLEILIRYLAMMYVPNPRERGKSLQEQEEKVKAMEEKFEE